MNKQTSDKLDNLFREQFQNHEIAPAEDYWPFLEESLDKVSFYKFGWKHINIYNISLGVLTIVLSLVFLFSHKKEEKKTEPTPQERHREDKNDNSSSIIAPASGKETKKEVRKELKKPEPKTTEIQTTPMQATTKDSALPILQENKTTPPEPVKVEEKPKPKPKKIIYVVEQDTIIQKDTVKVKRKRKN